MANIFICYVGIFLKIHETSICTVESKNNKSHKKCVIVVYKCVINIETWIIS